MTPSALEACVLRVVDQVAHSGHSEDSRVELKREWSKPANTAPLIAGHANAVRGVSILWIIGLDESSGIFGAPKEELANWYSSVKQSFDGLAPALYDLNVVVGQKTIVALLFETDRAPYVVRNSAYGPGVALWSEKRLGVKIGAPSPLGENTCFDCLFRIQT